MRCFERRTVVIAGHRGRGACRPQRFVEDHCCSALRSAVGLAAPDRARELEDHERDRDFAVPEPCSAHWRTCQPFLDCGERHRRSHRQCEETEDKIEAEQNRS